VFWFNLAFGALALIAAATALPESADPQGRRLDLSGLVLSAAAMTAATFAVIEGESAGYTTWWIDLLFAAAALAALAFFLVERRNPDPVLKLELFRNRTFSIANLAAFATSFGSFAVFFFTAYLQLIGNFSGWKIALQFLAMAVAIIVAAWAAGRWTARSGSCQPLTIGCLLAAAGLFAIDALLGPHVSFAALACALAVAGLGFGLALVAVTAAVLAVVPAERSGMAASILNTSRQLGGVLGVAILGALVNAQLTASLTHKLQQLGIPANFQAIVINALTHGGLPTSPAGVQNPAAAGHQTLVAQVIKAAEDAFASGLHLSLLVTGTILLAAAALGQLALAKPSHRSAGTVGRDERSQRAA
jgi:predicted MFS family arabinose efflux permease